MTCHRCNQVTIAVVVTEVSEPSSPGGSTAYFVFPFAIRCSTIRLGTATSATKGPLRRLFPRCEISLPNPLTEAHLRKRSLLMSQRVPTVAEVAPHWNRARLTGRLQ